MVTLYKIRALNYSSHRITSSLFINGVRLGDDRDNVDLAVELLHADEVEALEAVAVGGDEVEARVDSSVVEAKRCYNLYEKLEN